MSIKRTSPSDRPWILEFLRARWGTDHMVARGRMYYPDALQNSRRLKPEIPLMGDFGIPLRDELELDMRLP